jgi:hypothetical protein
MWWIIKINTVDLSWYWDFGWNHGLTRWRLAGLALPLAEWGAMVAASSSSSLRRSFLKLRLDLSGLMSNQILPLIEGTRDKGRTWKSDRSGSFPALNSLPISSNFQFFYIWLFNQQNSLTYSIIHSKSEEWMLDYQSKKVSQPLFFQSSNCKFTTQKDFWWQF